ncbi:sulfur carrier protein ThiS [Paenibacillus sp. JX-17]|uniref:Sulfur carrier protein ThiS n=1 Tax=Paenibacillus lacisoli TaxID=3064525 RepID=A0ABT9C8I5_9BACL|nr:sulfur carrier protein ThiS [Paenibacillus sp. JX-17]MDO7904913.1 sulfur carrier protein ThiS [Paenibacillus sp. JX-17]
MKLLVNGKEIEFASHINNVEKLLQELGLTVRTVVVELNRSILVRDQHGEAQLKDGDELEIVHFVGGG